MPAVAAAEEAANIARKAAKSTQKAAAASEAATAEAEAAKIRHQSALVAYAAAASAVTAASLFTQHIATAAASAHLGNRSQSRSLRRHFGAAGESPANQRIRTQDDRDKSRSPGQLHHPRHQVYSASTEEAYSETSPRRSSSALVGGGGEEDSSPPQVNDDEILKLIAMMNPTQKAALFQMQQQNSPQPTQQRTHNRLQPDPSTPTEQHHSPNRFAALGEHPLHLDDPHERGASLSQTGEDQHGEGG